MLEIRILGTAAGGGFPQWNCACINCRLAREGTLPFRTQSGAAVSANGTDWHLVNASPDVSRQIVQFLPARTTSALSERFDPVAGVFATNADLDHTLGLFQLREGARLKITAPAPVIDSLCNGLRMGAVLDAYATIDWKEAELAWRPVDSHGLEARAVLLRGTEPPRYDRDTAAGRHAVGYLFRADGKVVGIFPDVAVLDEELLDTLAGCDRVWFDGTFWSQNEMLPLNGRTAAQMGHVPICESLPKLASLGPGRVNYLHINNTNPILRPDSRERAAVLSAGLSIAEDGDRYTG